MLEEFLGFPICCVVAPWVSRDPVACHLDCVVAPWVSVDPVACHLDCVVAPWVSVDPVACHLDCVVAPWVSRDPLACHLDCVEVIIVVSTGTLGLRRAACMTITSLCLISSWHVACIAVLFIVQALWYFMAKGVNYL